MSLFPDDDEFARPAARLPRPGRPSSATIGWYLIIGAILATVVLALLPSPYVIQRPGPVFDTLGEVEIDGQTTPVIEIDGAPTFPTDGRLDLLTVRITGSRESPPSWLEVAGAWFDSTRAVVPIDAVFPAGQTIEEADEEGRVEMANSQQEATAAALEELDIAYQVTVDQVVEGSPAEGVLETGDLVVAAAGQPVEGISDLRRQIAANGTDSPMPLTVERDGVEQTVSVTPVAASENDPTPIIGVQAHYVFPFDVEIQLENVGGPSAGTMFALGIYDKLTDGYLTGGEHIAGTGTIRADGTVGPIGGIRQKLYGARDAGAEVFLAPQSNCDEVTGHIPDGIEVYSIATLDDAIAVLDAVAGDGATSNLPRCPA